MISENVDELRQTNISTISVDRANIRIIEIIGKTSSTINCHLLKLSIIRSVTIFLILIDRCLKVNVSY